MAPPHALFTPPPIEQENPSFPPSTVNKTMSPAPPLASRSKGTHGAPPPPLTSPELPPPPSGMSPRASPPTSQVMQGSSPPVPQHINSPKHAPFSRINASDPHAPPLPAPAPRDSPVNGASQSVAPPRREPDQLPPAINPPHPEPKFHRQNGTAPAPFAFHVHSPSAGVHHSFRHSPNKVSGSPAVIAPSPSSQEIPEIPPAPSPISRAQHGHSEKNSKRPLKPQVRSLPPPPPNAELAREIAAGVILKQSQVRVMGANAATEDPERSIVLVDMIPFDDNFDNVTSFLIFQRFWQKQVIIDKSIFGDYEVLYVRYPGLPPSPPLSPADVAVINGMPYSVGDPNRSKLHPLGVDVTKQRHKHRLSAVLIVVIVFSSVVVLLICCSVAWLLVFRHTNNNSQPTQTLRPLHSLPRLAGPSGLSAENGQSSPSSFGSSLATYTGSAKTFSASEMEKATNYFSSSRILGEGGFGLVYRGVLEDETEVAVKVLKREDQQGGREFLAEVEMLSRLHHRNLVRLIGICTDERLRCLAYELIPNGSVESHLHDGETSTLDWTSRVKIALGAARGLAYLHEDSSP